MPNIVLSEEQEEEIFQQTKNAFSDFPYFDSLVAVKLKQAIHDSRNSEINFATTMEGAAKYYDRKAFKVSGANIVQSDLELVWKHIKVIFRYAYVAIVAYTTQTNDFQNKALKEQFVINYPSFLSQEGMDSNKFNRLFVFWKMIRTAITIIQPERNKQTLIDVCGRFEDLHMFYITGKGQTQEVTNRVLIYEQEGNVEPEVRPWRSKAEGAAHVAAKAAGSSKKLKKKRSQDALKTANNVHLDPELVKWLALSVSPKMQKEETEESSFYSTPFTSLFDTIPFHAAPSVSSTTSLTGELDDLVGSIAFQTDLFLENGYFDEGSFLNNSSFQADCFQAYDTDCTVSDDSSDEATEDGPDCKKTKR